MSEVLLIGRDSLGHPRVVDLSSLKIELVVPAPKAHGGSGDPERRLAEARAGLEFYADGGTDEGASARVVLESLDDSQI